MADQLYSITVPAKLREMLSEKTAIGIVVRALNAAAEDVRALLAELTPKYTGETASRWRVTKLATATDLTVEISNDSVVAIYIEFGTGMFATPAGIALGIEVDLFEQYPSMHPRWVVRGNLPRFEDLLLTRMAEELGKVFGG